MKPYTIAIDGPAGAGKSTVARMLAKRLGYLYVDSGAMYRAVALKAKETGVDAADTEALSMLARTARITFVADDENGQQVFLDGECVTKTIRVPEIASLASVVSAVPGVRAALVAEQQAMGVQGGVVMEGRDIGTVVFPHAELKVYLTASPEERAKRRQKDITARGGTATVESVRADQDTRDARDTTRAVSPLVVASDAVEIISDGKTPEMIVGEMIHLLDSGQEK